MNINYSNQLIKTLLIGIFMTLTLPAIAAVESRDPIKLTIHDWTGQYLTTHIGRGAEKGWIQHRICSGRLHCAICRARIRRPAHCHGNVGDHG